MSSSSPQQHQSQELGVSRGRRSRNVAWLLLAVLVGLGIFGRGLVGGWGKFQAGRSLGSYSPSKALQWLEWTKRFAGEDGQVDLLRARAYRLLNRDSALHAALLVAARKEGAASTEIDLETRLYSLESGESQPHEEQELNELITNGQSPHEVCTAFVYSHLHHQDLESARRVLDAWEKDYPDAAQVAYVRGVFWRSAGDNAQAKSAFNLALEREPRHELAALALARLTEQQEWMAARAQWTITAKAFPASDEAHLGLARLLRRLGSAGEARSAIAPRLASHTPFRDVLLEASEIEFECSDYAKACSLLLTAYSNDERQLDQLLARSVEFMLAGKAAEGNQLLSQARTAAMTLSLGGEQSLGARLFERIDAIDTQLQRQHDLRVRLDQVPDDAEAVRELNELLAHMSAMAKEKLPVAGDASPSSPPQPRRDLYAIHCAACHGVDGDGESLAARHLDPPPRDFRHDHFRIVSSNNAVPSPQDVAEVIRLGMPGTSMPAFSDLTPQELQKLADQVLRFRSDGIREQLIPGSSMNETDETKIRDEPWFDLWQRQTIPDSPQPIPIFGARDDAAISRGKEAFAQLGCHHCHATTQQADNSALFFDENGSPTPARNLASEPFKGGRDPRSIYLRLRLGMPGTAHPACVSVADEQLVDLVHYCRSLEQSLSPPLTNHERSVRNCASE